MRLQFVSAAVLGAALATGCGGKGQENPQNSNETAATTPADATGVDRQAVSPERDNSAVRPDSSGSRATAGNRAPSSSNSSALPRNDSARSETARNVAPREVAPPVPVVHEVTVPAGTNLPLELTTALSSETATVESPVEARLTRAIEVNGRTALPAGAVLHGNVTDVERAGKVKGRSHLAFRFTSVTVAGARENLRTNPVSFEGEASKGDDAKKVGIGAGIGAAIGAIAGGGSGAAKGAAIGGGAGTAAVLATRGKEVELAAGTPIETTTANALTLEVK